MEMTAGRRTRLRHRADRPLLWICMASDEPARRNNPTPAAVVATRRRRNVAWVARKIRMAFESAMAAAGLVDFRSTTAATTSRPGS